MRILEFHRLEVCADSVDYNAATDERLLAVLLAIRHRCEFMVNAAAGLQSEHSTAFVSRSLIRGVPASALRMMMPLDD